MLQVALAQRRLAAAADCPATPAAAASTAACWTRSTRGCRSRSPPASARSARTIAADLARAHPMHRLLQGEVGSGKTVVALRAMLQVVDAGGQAALLAPTEVLAAAALPVDHRACSARWPRRAAGRRRAGHPGRAADRVAGRRRPAARRCSTPPPATPGSWSAPTRCSRSRCSSPTSAWSSSTSSTGSASSSGTRCGPRPADSRPHVLVMTATPIPRTVAMTVFGDLETSTLTELPAGRAPIATHVVPGRREAALPGRGPGSGSARRSGRGRQAYVVCPRIGEAATARAGDGRPTRADDDPDDVAGRGRGRRGPARPAAGGARRGRRRWPRARWPGCGSACCTAGCRPRRRTR